MLKQTKPKILVVDDEETLTYTIETFLSREGYEVDTAGSYQEGVGKLSGINFDLILTDIMLGDGTGVDILQEVNKRNQACPVILITGYPNIETAIDAVRGGHSIM